MQIKVDKLPKNELRYFSSLLTKKGRKNEGKFLVEGKRIVEEALKSNYLIQVIFVTPIFIEKNEHFLLKWKHFKNKIKIVTEKQFNKLSDTKSPQGIAIVLKDKEFRTKLNTKDSLIVALENISDPGNLGTILRNCDWFGISQVIINNNCAEVVNPKTIRSSMGSLFHLNIIKENNFYSVLSEVKKSGFQIIFSDLNGENIFKIKKPLKAIISFSNEAFGPSDDLKNIADYSITIPKFGKAESLNVASASAVILSQLIKH